MGPRSKLPSLFQQKGKMRRFCFSLTLLFSCVLWVANGVAAAQDFPARQSFGFSSTFSPDSSHILLGSSQQRRVWTAGFEYGRTIFGNDSLRLDYEGSISPFFQERDPTETGEIATLPDGSTIIFPTSTVRVVDVNAPIGYLSGYGGPPVPLYPLAHGTEKTYALSVSPLGARLNGFNRSRIQTTFSSDLGLVFSSRDLPIDNSARLNYLFSFGPGLEIFYKKNEGIRFEYLFRHMSNANSGSNNPGVDAGVFRLTITRRHH
jgi:hypothetical protein